MAGAGDGRALSTAQRLQNALAADGHRARIGSFADLDSLARWTRSCEGDFPYLVCVGGDTTQSVAAGAALRLGIPLVPVPNGFGNMFAGALGLPAAPEAIVDLLKHGEICRVDVGQAGSDRFLSHRTYGPLQHIEEAVEPGRSRLRSRWLRCLAYCLTAIRYLVGKKLPSIRVDVDHMRVIDDALMVTVANVETYRGFLSLTPDAVPTDGLFDLFAMPRTTKSRMWATLLRIWMRSPLREERIVRCRGHRVCVTVDDRPPEEIRMLPGALRVLVPTARSSTERARGIGTRTLAASARATDGEHD
jgi:diacylglycerol kinase (ATP)